MIQYTPEVMETIRAAAVEGLYKLGRGGLEVGGVLFGRQTLDGIEILSSRPLEIEHANGPTFTLSEADHAALSELLQLPSIDSDLRGMAPVGWYHSHTRSGLSLTPQDLEIHERYFSEAWQAALLLHPEKTASSRALFFTRGSGGSLNPESLILLDAPPRQRKAVAVPAPVVQAIHSETAPSPIFSSPFAEPAGPESVPPPRTAEPTELWPIPPSLEPPPQVRRLNPWPWLLFAVALGVAVISTAFAFRSYWLPEAAAPQLRLFDLDGQLSINWDRSSGPVAEAQGGTLEITDGEKKSIIQMSGDQLRKGNAVYSRQSRAVVARLVLFLPNSRQAEAVASFAGNLPKPATAEAQDTEQLKAELELLQAELERQNKRNRELEAANVVLLKKLSNTKK